VVETGISSVEALDFTPREKSDMLLHMKGIEVLFLVHSCGK
jgi:hypothetical protein